MMRPRSLSGGRGSRLWVPVPNATSRCGGFNPALLWNMCPISHSHPTMTRFPAVPDSDLLHAGRATRRVPLRSRDRALAGAPQGVGIRENYHKKQRSVMRIPRSHLSSRQSLGHRSEAQTSDRTGPRQTTRRQAQTALSFPTPHLWQPSHDYLAKMRGKIAYWLHPCHPNPNGFGGRA